MLAQVLTTTEDSFPPRATVSVVFETRLLAGLGWVGCCKLLIGLHGRRVLIG